METHARTATGAPMATRRTRMGEPSRSVVWSLTVVPRRRPGRKVRRQISRNGRTTGLRNSEKRYLGRMPGEARVGPRTWILPITFGAGAIVALAAFLFLAERDAGAVELPVDP